MIGDAHMPIRSILATCLPAGAPIPVFGPLYGAAARAIMGVPLTLASSVFIFSGALQFALLALLSAGATILPLVLIALVLNLRPLVLGAVPRPRLEGSRRRRAALAFFLVDETFGFAVAAGQAAERARVPGGGAMERTFLVSGILSSLAWPVGLPGGERGGRGCS